MEPRHSERGAPSPHVGLFVTCLADLFRPSVAWASLTLLERAGCRVSVPSAQTCCGQPAYNSGDKARAVPLAKSVIRAFEGLDYVVAPSGSCAGMLKVHYPRLLEGEWRQRAEHLAQRTWELSAFLTEVTPLPLPANRPDAGHVAFHDSCAGLRELGVREQPRHLLRQQCSADIAELDNRDVCCGFGGTFCAKMPDISTKMCDDKLKAVSATGAPTLVGGDLGCLLNLAGRARRQGQNLQVRHFAELLVGDINQPAIGESGD